MNAVEVTHNLISGQANLDRMRSEIQTVISIILGGHFDPLTPRFTSPVRLVQTPDYEWWGMSLKTGLNVVEQMTYATQARCSIKKGRRIPTTFFFQTDGRGPHIGNESVATVHKSLPAYVEAMLKRFPRLEKDLQPYLDAAAK